MTLAQSPSTSTTVRLALPGTIRNFWTSSANDTPSEYTSAVPVKPAADTNQRYECQ